MTVTTTDPGGTPHSEVVIAGTDAEAGLSGVPGIVPFSCGFIANTPVFTFGNLFGTNSQSICEVAARQAAHSYGLENHFECSDVMNSTVCGDKHFRDLDMACGDASMQACICGGTTANSFEQLAATYGVIEGVFSDGFELPPPSGSLIGGGCNGGILAEFFPFPVSDGSCRVLGLTDSGQHCSCKLRATSTEERWA